METRSYLCIDLKSFYASVECVERGLDPMTTDLVVADPERSAGTICLAVSPSLKAKGVKNRCRVFEIPQGLSYIMAPPRMQKYIDYAADIYRIYLRYLAPEDIYVYSIDEAFLDVTPYLRRMGKTPREMAVFLMDRIQQELGLRSTAGVGSNLYLAKIALDITAKHAADFIGELDEDSYRELLWDHRPLTDFWRIGPGISRRLQRMGIYTQRQITEASEDRLYREFGVDAELLIDHAWGREPTTMADIKHYAPKSRSLTSGQVLWRDYSFEEGQVIVKEMLDLLCLDLVDQGLVTDSVGIMVGYSNALHAEPVSGTARLDLETNADRVIIPAVLEVYRRIVDPAKPIRRFNFSCNDLHPDLGNQQFSLFLGVDGDTLVRNRKIQQAVLGIRKKYGKNAMLKGVDFEPAATTRERNRQIGGHKSGE
jgi:DNA polymerase V